MSEPPRKDAADDERDVALEIDAPKKTQQPTRTRKGARDGHRKEDAFRDGQVLENDAVETRIIRENTRCHPDMRTFLRSLCFVVLLTALIYVCLILHDVRSFLFKAQEKLNDMSTLTTSVGDLETTLVNVRDSVSNTTHVSNFIQETFSSLTGDVTLEETLGSLGEACEVEEIRGYVGERYTMGESAFKRGVCIDKDCQMAEIRR